MSPRSFLSPALLLALLVGTACGSADVAPPASAAPAETTLSILATNDFHGGLIAASKGGESGQALGGAVGLAGLITEQRAKNPEATLLLDAGDSFHGTPLSNLTQGRATIDFMNRVGFDATVAGNHAFDWGVEVLRERIEQADFPFLTANIHDRETGARPPWARPYTIVERGGLRIAIIGLTTTGTPRTTLPKNVAGLEFLDPAPIANRLIEELVPARADLAILLCHLGLRNPESAEPNGELRRLTRQVRGAAAVVGGHTHEVFAGELDGFPVVQAMDSGKYLGRIDLRIDPKERQVVGSEVQVFEVPAEPRTPVPAIAELVAGYEREFERSMQQVLGVAAHDIEWVGDRECRMGNLFTDAIRQQTGADIVLQNPFGLRASFSAGEITREDVFEVMPFDNTIVLVELTGAEIRQTLELAVERLKLLYVSGLRYTVDPEQPPGSRVSTPLDDDTVYRVAINNFLAQGGDGLSVLKDRPEARDTGILLRDAFADWIAEETRRGRRIRGEVDGRSPVG